ncbi:MAG: molybdopterin guanine dinucleotide-containing S/N-oxide reductase [Burkholderiales bacterium]|nr:molybdopterin guanine dinucleotide-containing S/N-oxide reductase [Burkholderiales bacterium]
MSLPARHLVATHWGTYLASAGTAGGEALRPLPEDSRPSSIGIDLPASRLAPARILRPAVRESYLRSGPRADRGRRGAEPFVEVSWDTALDLVAAELERVRESSGNSAIFGGSCGWASAGRFHHAQSHVHRFLNCIGGYTRSVGNYSYGAADVLLPHVIGDTRSLAVGQTRWESLRQGKSLVLMFGGMPAKNGQVGSGGIVDHRLVEQLAACKEAGCRFVCVSPVRSDAPTDIDARWLPLRPNTDVALMLGLAHVLVTESLCDAAFLDRHTVGFDALRDYLLGRSDAIAKTPEWAAGITEVPADEIRKLARELAGSNAFVMLTWSLQRAHHGEQPYWMAIALACMLGGVGLPGRGVGFGYGSMGGVGFAPPSVQWAALPQGGNPVEAMIPVARIADMLLKPGERFDFDGKTFTYPEIRLVYWAGGNPFHHHQDTNRLLQAWRVPETIVVHEAWWNAHARHADIVLPVTTFFERDDLCGSSRVPHLVASRRVSDPPGDCLDDYAIFSRLASLMKVEQAYTEGRDTVGWIRHLYERTVTTAGRQGHRLPDFATFWDTGLVEVPEEAEYLEHMQAFRADPVLHPLSTPSGRIELSSSTIAGFGYADCPGHPAWIEPMEWLGSAKAARHPLHLLANQPADKLHSQWDHGILSRSNKIQGRARLGVHPEDAASRGLAEGDVVRVFNDRGAILAGVAVDTGIRQGVVLMSTGAWFDPLEPGVIGSLDKHGNPNVLTPDIGTSSLAQGPSPNTCLVQVERFESALPPITCFHPPELLQPP